MCLVHVNLLFKYIPRYLASLTLGRGRSYGLTVGQFPFLVVNVICTDFVSLAFMRHSSSNVWISKSCFWRFLDAISGSWCAANIAVSSAYVATVTSFLLADPWCIKYIGLIPARFLLALQTWLDGILISRVHVVRKIVYCIITIWRVRSIEVNLFLFFTVDRGAGLCQKLAGCLVSIR